MAKKEIKVLGNVEEIKGAKSKVTKNQYKNEIGPEAKIEKKEISIAEKIMNEDFMKKFHEDTKIDKLPVTVKEFVENNLQYLKEQEFEIYMLTQESRKIYYLFINDCFVGQYKSIMEVKIFTMKLAALLKKEIKANYFKPGRKTQASEKISGKSYSDKIEKYQNI